MTYFDTISSLKVKRQILNIRNHPSNTAKEIEKVTITEYKHG